MRVVLTTVIALCATFFVQAQTEGQVKMEQNKVSKVYRTQVAPYNVRKDADARKHTEKDAYRLYSPSVIASEGDQKLFAQDITFPYAWSDGMAYIHLENIGSAYTLVVNGQIIANVEDPTTPADFYISPALSQESNNIAVLLRPSDTPSIDNSAQHPQRTLFEGSYFYMQHKRSIADFDITFEPDPTNKKGILNISIIARNAYIEPETVDVGFDIYSPQGKLLDYNIKSTTIDGRSLDTVKFSSVIEGTFANKWQFNSKSSPNLYRVMIFTRRQGAYKEYMPLKIGFSDVELRGGLFYNFDKLIESTPTSYTAAKDKATTTTQLKGLRSEGKSLIKLDSPQPSWFYELCDQLGLYVIDCANINAPQQGDSRVVGGTPSNDPALLSEYLERVESMYFRSRNHTCVVAFSLGGDVGNGYNMYKAYEFLKSLESDKPVIFDGAQGEWNSDK